MKKTRLFSALIAVALLISAACASAASADDAANPGGQQVIVRFDTVSDLFFDPAEQTTAILSYTCERPYVIIDSNHAAADAINEALDLYYAGYLPASEGISADMDMETYLLSLAEDYYTQYSASAAETASYLYTFSHRAFVTRCDDDALVFSFSDYFKDADETHTDTSILAFSAVTGEQISAEDYPAVQEMYPESGSSEDGFFAVYTAEQFADNNRSEGIPVIDLLEISPEGEDWYLCVTGELHDVRLSSVVYYDRCYEKEQLWYCNIMKNEALQFKYIIPDDNPDLKVSVNSAVSGAGESVLMKDTISGLVSVLPPDDYNSIG